MHIRRIIISNNETRYSRRSCNVVTTWNIIYPFGSINVSNFRLDDANSKKANFMILIYKVVDQLNYSVLLPDRNQI